MKLAIGTGNFNKKFFFKRETLNNNNKNLIRLFNDSVILLSIPRLNMVMQNI